jgi:hypothetical protein
MEKFYIEITKEAVSRYFDGFAVTGVDANVYDMSKRLIAKNVFVDCMRHRNSVCGNFELSKLYKVGMTKEEDRYVLFEYFGSIGEDEWKLL